MARALRCVLLGLLISLLSACSIFNNPILQTIQHATNSTGVKSKVSLSPNFQYLRVVEAGRVLYLVLGNVDVDTAGERVNVWYSATGEVLRIRDGHVVGATGLFTEWRNVNMPLLPSWSKLASSGKPYIWMRNRDVMPSYQYGIKDTMVLRKISPPRQNNLKNITANQLVWFEEDDISKLNPLPPARFAVADGHVEYSEVCLDNKLCFSWQRWPTIASKANNEPR